MGHLLDQAHIGSVLSAYGYWAIFLVVALESAGLPLPGETMLVGASIYARLSGALSIEAIVLAAAGGAIVGDNIGYWIGREFGYLFLERHGWRVGIGANKLRLGQYLFYKWGGAIVFFGRFVALLRILAGPLAGALHMRYRLFLVSNAGGALCWAGGTTAVVYYAGLAAEHWLSRFSWVALVVAVAAGIGLTWFLRGRTAELIAQLEAEHDWDTLRRPGRTVQ